MACCASRRCHGCVCLAHPLQGAGRYLSYLVRFRWVTAPRPSKGAPSSRVYGVLADINHYAQALYLLGVLAGLATLIAFLALSYVSVDGDVHSGEFGQPVVSSLCPGVWVGLFLAGA